MFISHAPNCTLCAGASGGWSRENHIEFNDPRTRAAVRTLTLAGCASI